MASVPKHAVKEASLSGDIQQLCETIAASLSHHFELGSTAMPRLPGIGVVDDGHYNEIVNELALDPLERAALTLALIPHLDPTLLDRLVSRFLRDGGDFPEFGGVRGKQFRGFLPTEQTLLFVLAGTDVATRVELRQQMQASPLFRQGGMLSFEAPPRGEPSSSGRLVIDPMFVERILTGTSRAPQFGAEFPAEEISTQMTWEDIVLPNGTLEQINHLNRWLQHGDTLLNDWGMAPQLRKGYRVLFHGPPGTGKTLTAKLLGQTTGRPVFRIDLALIVSKYIGETEKNLANLFNVAENKDWILFFDEADALFGKRTQVRDAHDRYANQEVAYLLQRVENCSGLVILATNLANNIDSAFLRRFESSVHFPMPSRHERFALWQRAFPQNAELEDKICLTDVAMAHELSGAHIVNVVQQVCLMALDRGENTIRQADLEIAIARELSKEGKLA